MDFLPENTQSAALVVCVAAILAYNITQMVRSMLKVRGWDTHPLANTGLRALSTVIGGKAGLVSATVWLPEGKAVGGLLLGLCAGAFATGIVWLLKRVLYRRLGVGTRTLSELEALDGNGDNSDGDRGHRPSDIDDVTDEGEAP